MSAPTTARSADEAGLVFNLEIGTGSLGEQPSVTLIRAVYPHLDRLAHRGQRPHS